jgi:hypothetical protein
MEVGGQLHPPAILPPGKEPPVPVRWETGQEILHTLRNSSVHYRVHKSLLPVPILSQMNPVHTLAPYFPKIHFNIIFPYTSGSFPSGFSI